MTHLTASGRTGGPVTAAMNGKSRWSLWEISRESSADWGEVVGARPLFVIQSSLSGIQYGFAPLGNPTS